MSIAPDFSIDKLKSAHRKDLTSICNSLRTFLIDTILQSGGHFAGNLGVVELTVALHYFYNSPQNAIIWDVGHQSYIHKILTGRAQDLYNIRQYSGISGFPKISENPHDIFGTGHSSTAISAASGIAAGLALQGFKNRKTIAVVGDGALTGGMSFEALNNLSANNQNVLVIINDNHIGIDPNTGALDRHLQNITQHKPNIFENLGLRYFGPLDGHNTDAILDAFEEISENDSPAILHIKTVKGKGYPPAENEQTFWHSTSKFVKIDAKKKNRVKWQDAFGTKLLELAKKHSDICAVTPAMPSGSGMLPVMKEFPNRFFDVGIAEQHAVTFSAGLALTKQVPYLNIYSTFLQRGYDQLIHDVALQNIPVIFCIDRAGLVGEDGPTHHGVFDISFMLPIPGIIMTAPANAWELSQLLEIAYFSKVPFSIRYPKGEIPEERHQNPIEIGKGIQLKKGEHLAVISTGYATELSTQGIEIHSSNVSHYHFPFIKPLDANLLMEIKNNYNHIITVEDGSIAGGFGEMIGTFLFKNGFRGTIKNLGVPDDFVTHGANDMLYRDCGFHPEDISKAIQNTLLHF